MECSSLLTRHQKNKTGLPYLIPLQVSNNQTDGKSDAPTASSASFADSSSASYPGDSQNIKSLIQELLSDMEVALQEQQLNAAACGLERGRLMLQVSMWKINAPGKHVED
jgi:hypothetical protein